jgi:gliding motility-associated-like protein
LARDISTGCVSDRIPVEARVNVIPQVPDTIGSQICGPGSLTLKVNVPAKHTADWYSAAVGGDLLKSDSLSHTLTNIQLTTTVYAVSRDLTSGCVSDRIPVVATINAIPSAPQTIDTSRCLTGSIQLSAIPASGSTTDWYAAASGGNVLSGGIGTNQFNTPSISASTIYYAQSRNLESGCLSTSRTPVTVQVDALSLAGSIAGAKEVCAGSNNTELLLSGQRGNIQWQASADNVSFNDIIGANQVSFNAIDLSVDTYFRVVIKNGACDAVQSPGIKMLVSQPSTAGEITGMKAVCAENNATVLRVTGTNGAIQWQSSIDRTIFSDIVGATADSLLTLNLVRTTYYRVVVKNGVCVNSTSPDVTQTVNALPPAPVTEDGTRCGKGQVILKAFPPTGVFNVIDWYADSIRGSSPALKVNNTLFVTPDVIGTKYYYAESRNRFSNCVSASRVAAMAEIIPFAKIGTIAGDSMVCAGLNETVLKISDYGGRIQWQESTNNINFANIVDAQSDTVKIFNLNQTHYYRVLLNADNGCNPSITDTFSILASQPSLAGIISGVQEVCSGSDSIALNLSGFVGDIQWQSSIDSTLFTDIDFAVDSILQLNRLTQSTFYRAKLKSGICSPDTADVVKITVNELPATPVATDVVNCRVGPVELNAIPPDGSTTDWFAVPDGGEVINRGYNTGSYFTDTLNSTAFFYVQARNIVSGCISTERAKVTALFDPAAIPTISGDPGLCNGDSLLLKTDQVYGIQWFFNGDSLAGVNSQSIIIKKFGDYRVIFTNTSGCSNESATKTVLGYPDILGNLVKPDKTDICDGYALKLSANGSFGYQWFMNGLKVTDSISDTYNARIAGTYTLQYISDKGCKVMDPDSIRLRLIKTPDAKYSIGTTTCINIPVEFINKSSVAESGNVFYNWEFGNGKKDTGFVMNHIYDKPGLYMTRLVVTPASCLMLADTALLYVKVESPVPAIRYPAVNAVVNKAILLQARDFGSEYQWFPATGLSDGFIKNPVAIISQQQDYKIAITTTAGCTTTDSLLVRVFRENDIMVPEGFSPNSDGQNDKLYPFLIGIKQMNLFRVYDRWGNLIYDNKLATSSSGWDGSYKGNPLPAGPYVWMGEGVDVDDKVIRRTGTIILIK